MKDTEIIIQQNQQQQANLAAPLIPAKIQEKIEFENDFGASPMLLAHVTEDQSIIVILALVGAFIGCAVGGIPIAAAILLAGMNDVRFAGRESASHPTRLMKGGEEPMSSPPTETPAPTYQEPPVSWAMPQAAPSFADVPAPFYPVSLPPQIDIAEEMGKALKSTLIVASPRVGKGVLVSMAISHVRQFNPDTEIWLLDPKAQPEELGYWEVIPADRKCHHDIRDFDPDTEEAVARFSSLLSRFNQSRAASKLLIIDEFVTLNQKLPAKFMSQLKDFLVGICSSGELAPDRSLGRFAWCLSQSPYVTDFGFKTKAALSTFQRVFLLNKSSKNFYLIAAGASFVPPGLEQKTTRMLEQNERICYYSRLDSWQPIPNYNSGKNSSNTLTRINLADSLPSFREVAGSSPEVAGNPGSFSQNPEAPEAQREVALPGFEEWRKYFPEAPEVVEEALFLAYQRSLEVEGGKKEFILRILKSGEGGRRYQAAVTYLNYLSQKFGGS